ncbi:putative protein serine/threonine kinase [Tieghemostelium lacteum]|uniref:non-specific serine/threonine protein kinase n=1 Tax=Tieghemostelium lacteum TaxID=361077 RepID=A0A151ZFQ0_TIELA|nr:putative protein serine/threonine kinase [Tieghemostelium lacteum]|eukprot:KYQ92802.1 putative protein serine/threonine kinase [Tieghemostelium lacteum]
MGNTVGAPIVSEYLEDEIGPIVCQNSLGNASRFLKTVKAFHDEEGYVVVKIYKKRTNRDSLEKYKRTLKENRDSFNVTHTTYNYYNIMPYQNFLETDRSGYLIRQYFHNNLYDRISTRPFLSMIEKKFITYQLLKGLEQSFFMGINHGDIKSENVMVTTNNWIYLTDFASYKPTFIPQDNPSDFSFYFDTSGRRTCYIAPERFYETNKGMPEGELTDKMDIFSLGCVIAEIFLEGIPIFDFSQLLSYIKGEYSPEPVIRRIPDPHIQSLILSMIQKEPEQRHSPEKYLQNWKNRAFPAYFDFAHQFISELMKLDNDDRIFCLSDNFEEIIQIFSNNTVPSNSLGMNSPSNSSPSLQSTTAFKPATIPQQQPSNLSLNPGRDTLNKQQTQDALNSSQTPTPPISTSTQIPVQTSNNNNNISNIIFKTETFIKEQEKFDRIDLNGFKLEELNVSLKSEQIQQQVIGSSQSSLIQSSQGSINQVDGSVLSGTGSMVKEIVGTVEGLDIFLSMIYSALKYSKYPHTKVKGISSLLERFAQHLDDECKLQKIVPYLMSMIFSSTQVVQPSLVRVEALRSLAKVLEMVQNFPPSESAIFSQYILPSLSQLSSDQTDEIVRIAYAEVLPQLATTAKRFLEIAQRYRDPDQQRKDRSKFRVYDSELNEIQDLFLTKVSDLLTKDSCITLKRIILSDIYRLCVFFGRQKTNESVLPLIITFLNDKDWQLRCAFFENIVAVCTVVGAGSLESFIYPCILLALADEEEFVTEKALASLTELVALGLLRKNILLELLIKTSPMLLHPNNWIRYGVISLIIRICSSLSKADLHCYAKPKLSMFLQGEISDNINENNLFHLLEQPISRDSFNKIVKVIYKNQVSLSASLHSNHNDGPSSPQMLNLGTGGSYRRLRALSQKLYPVNGSTSSFGNGSISSSSTGISLSHMDEHQQNFLSQMNELKIPSEDQEKIFKCLDYLLLKKYKDDDGSQTSTNSQPITVTNNNIIRQSIAKQATNPNLNPNSSSSSSSAGIEITKLPTSTPVRLTKMRSLDPTLSSSGVNLPTMSSSTTSLPQLSINQINSSQQNIAATLSSSNPVISQSSLTPSPNLSNNQSNNNNNISNNNNNISNNNNQQTSINTQTTSSNNSNNSNNSDNLNVNQLELNIVSKKFKILSKQAKLSDILKVETHTDCYIYTAPPLPDMGAADTGAHYSGVLNSNTGGGAVGGTTSQIVTQTTQAMNSPLHSSLHESSALPTWKPQGILVSHFFEHTSAVNEIQVSKDNLFFATASNDGTVKIWDCQRMEKSVTNKARLSYQQDGGRITSISICEKTHSIASASDRGSIHIIRVGMGGKQKSGNLKYTGFSTVKRINELEGNIVGVEHFSTNSTSIVTYATSKGGIKGWDLRSQQQAFQLVNEASLGLIQALLIDPNRNWFVTGTSRGFITCWDLRFRIPLYNYRVTNGRIFKLIPYLGGLRSSIETSWIYISTEMDNVILFDLASKSTKRIFKRSFNDSSATNLNSTATPSSSTFSSVTPISMTPTSSHIPINILQGSQYDFATENMRPLPKSTILPVPNLQNLPTLPNTPGIPTSSSVTSSSIVNNGALGGNMIEKKTPIIRAMLSPVNCSYLITAGDDKRIKFWEGKNIIDSYYISNGKEPPPPFTHKYSNNTNLGLETFEEVWCDPNASSFYPNSIQSSISNIQSKQKQKSPITTPTIHHQEPILDLKVMEVPNPMLISASTDGIVKVWK